VDQFYASYYAKGGLRMFNFINVFCSRRRWIKRILINQLDDIAYVKLKSNGLKIFYNPKDLTGPSFHLAYGLDKGFQNYEEQEKYELLDHIPPNGVFVDIGANIGMFSLFILGQRPDITTYSFEPEPQTFKCISKTKSANQLDHLNLFPFAIGEERDELKLYRSIQNDGGHSLIKDIDLKDNIPDELTVKVMPLDDALPNNLDKIHAIKIDVEGAEESVLKGAINTIKEHKPLLLIETSNAFLAKKEVFYQILSENFPEILFARLPGSKERLKLSEVSEIAQKRLDQGIEASNYIFQFI
jgi:FkbM family methyltransferase